MRTRKQEHRLELDCSPEEVFRLLITPSAIRQWWQVRSAIVTPQEGGLWSASWGEDEDEPDYICSATLSIFDPPRRLKMIDFRYFSRTGSLPFDADFSNEFLIEATENGCNLTVIQDGFPADSVADEYFAGCEAGWKTTLEGIENYTKMKRNEDIKDTPS